MIVPFEVEWTRELSNQILENLAAIDDFAKEIK